MRLAERYARLIVSLRWLVLPLVGAITRAALTMLPSVAATGGGLSNVIGADDPAIQAQIGADLAGRPRQRMAGKEAGPAAARAGRCTSTPHRR